MPHAVTLIRSDKLATVAQYAYAATAPIGARYIFLAGACPLNDDGSTAGIGDYATQAQKASRTCALPLTTLVRPLKT